MQVQREQLGAVLSAVRPGLAKKEIFEQTTHFIFTGENLTTYNDQICISHPFETDFQCSVKAIDLYKTVTGLTSDLLDLSLVKDKLVLETPRHKLRLSTIVDPQQTVDKLSAKLRYQCEEGEWQKIPHEMLEAIELCSFSASTDLTTGALTGVLISGNNIFSSDKFRCSWYHMSEPIVSDSFILQAKDVQELCKFPIEQVQLHENWAHFLTADSVQFSTRRLLGEYKDIKWIFEDTEKQEVRGKVRLPDDLKKTIDLVKDIAETEGRNINVKIELKDNQMICHARKERGDVQRITEIKYNRTPVEFSVNPAFLSQILDKTTTLTVTDTRAYFVTPTFKHILALVVKREEVAPPGPDDDIPF